MEEKRGIFTAQSFDRADEKNQIIMVPPAEVRPFQEHTFKVRDDAGMKRLVKSVKEHGILEPALAFFNEDGEMELISGHRRRKVAMELKLEYMQILVKEVTREEATVLMGETNLMQREKVLPSEKGFTYQAMLAAIRKMPDREDDIERARDLLSRRVGDSPAQIQRYIRLTKLIPELLELVDLGKMSFRAGLDVANMGMPQQQEIFRIYRETDILPTYRQSKQLKELMNAGELKEEMIREIILEEEKNPSDQKLVFKSPILVSMLSAFGSIAEREDRIIQGLRLLAEEEEKDKRLRIAGKEDSREKESVYPEMTEPAEAETQQDKDRPSEGDREEVPAGPQPQIIGNEPEEQAQVENQPDQEPEDESGPDDAEYEYEWR